MLEGKTRRRILAGLLSLFLPGLGQIYSNQIAKGIIWAAIIPVWIFLSSALGLLHGFRGLVLCLAVQLIFQFFAAADAWRSTPQPAEKSHRASRFAGVALAGVCIVAADYGATRLVTTRMYKISAGSMTPTIIVGDRIAADTAYYKARTPRQGEVVVVRAPGRQLFVKRVIAVAGEVIEGKTGKVYVNGKALIEPYTILGPEREPSRLANDSQRNFGPVAVPQDKFFVIGDNRDHSWDSRTPSFGPVAKGDIRGKVLYIYWSNERSRIGRKIN